MKPSDQLVKILAAKPSEKLDVYVSIPGGVLSEDKLLHMNDPSVSIGDQISMLKEVITLGSQDNLAMISAEMDTYARVKIKQSGERAQSLPLGMAVRASEVLAKENSPLAILSEHNISKDCVKDFYSGQWPSLYSEFGSVGVNGLLKNKNLNADISDFLSEPRNTIRVSPDTNSSVIETGINKTVILSGRSESGIDASRKTSAFLNVNLSYLVNKGLSQYPSLQTMIASDIGTEVAIKNEHIKEGAGVLSALKTAVDLDKKQLSEVTEAMSWVNKESTKKFTDFNKITNDNSYPVKDRIEWVLERQEELGKMKSLSLIHI